MNLRSIKSPEVYLHIPESPQHHPNGVATSTQSQTHKIQPHLIFFLTGNPGLVGYYHEFLALLSQSSTSHASEPAEGNSSSLPNCMIAGMSLAGFETGVVASNSEVESNADSSSTSVPENDQDLQQTLLYPPGTTRKSIYSLQDQIQLSYDRLAHLSQLLLDSNISTATSPIKVTLIGHSVGTYIALEMIRKTQLDSTNTNTSSIPRPFSITSTILLTPTILDLRLSPSGQLANPLLSTIPFLPGFIQLCSSSLTSICPRSWLTYLVRRVTGMTNTNGLVCTVDFLSNNAAVKQALSMARDELAEITEDKWDWESVIATTDGREMGSSRIRHYLWFARGDHWVAESTREKIVEEMRKRSHAGSKSCTVLVSDDGLVHAWCLEQSEMVAKQVKVWIREILRESER